MVVGPLIRALRNWQWEMKRILRLPEASQDRDLEEGLVHGGQEQGSNIRKRPKDTLDRILWSFFLSAEI
jgi:hypothetical protein